MQPKSIPNWWPEHLEVSDTSVDVADLDAGLQVFLAAAAARHFRLFDAPLIITSGHDGTHAAGSKHYEWKAVDLRARDLSLDQQQTFGVVLVQMTPEFKIGVFDERYITGPHWHVETA